MRIKLKIWGIILVFFNALPTGCSSSQQSDEENNKIIKDSTNRIRNILQKANYVEEIFESDTIQLLLPVKLDIVQITDLNLSHTGDIIVADARFAKTVLFDHEGQFVGEVGRQGQGPGEYVSPTHVLFNKRNEIIIGDHAIQRISFFNRERDFLHSFNVPHRIDGLLISENDDVIIYDRRNRNEEEPIKIYSRKGKLLKKFGSRSFASQELLSFPFRPPGPYLTINGESLYQADYADYHIRKYWNHGRSQLEFGVEPEQYRSPLSTNYRRAAVPRGRKITPEEEKQVFDYLNNEFSKCTTMGCILTLCPGIIYTIMINPPKSGFDKHIYCDFYDTEGKLIKSGLTFISLSPRPGFPSAQLQYAPPDKLFIVYRNRYSNEKETIQLIQMKLKATTSVNAK